MSKYTGISTPSVRRYKNSVVDQALGSRRLLLNCALHFTDGEEPIASTGFPLSEMKGKSEKEEGFILAKLSMGG